VFVTGLKTYDEHKSARRKRDTARKLKINSPAQTPGIRGIRRIVQRDRVRCQLCSSMYSSTVLSFVPMSGGWNITSFSTTGPTRGYAFAAPAARAELCPPSLGYQRRSSAVPTQGKSAPTVVTYRPNVTPLKAAPNLTTDRYPVRLPVRVRRREVDRVSTN
jgi:hypothetical protein